MNSSIENRKKQLLALLLSALMVSSFGALAACNNEDSSGSSSSSSSSSTDEEVDNALVTNGNFETFDKNDGLNLIGTSVTGWTRSVNSATSGSALSSKAASGIVDVSDDAWTDLTTSKVANAAELTDEEAKNQWANMTSKDKLAFIEAWKARSENKDKTISKELDFYQSFNVDSEDLPTCENPGTHGGEDTKILMIHNQYPETDTSSTYKNLGTAQKFTSSSTVTVAPGTAAYFSVWVKTSELQSSSSSGEPQDAVGKGAYISITHSVGGKTMDAYEVKNINTENVKENNGWKQYTFYLRGASYVDTTFNIVLGLGQGGGTDRLEYVNGYAFFDDIECETISSSEFEKKTKNLECAGFESVKEDKIVDAYASDEDEFAIDFYGEFYEITVPDTKSFLSTVNTIAPTTEKIGSTIYTAANGTSSTVYPGLGLNTSNDKTQVYQNSAALNGSGNKYLQSVYDKYFKDSSFLSDSELLMLLSADGAAYTAKSKYEFEVKADSYLALTFYVKTSEMNGFTGAGITLNDGNNKTSFDSIDTTTLDTTDIGDEEDIYDGWKQYFFFVYNETDSTKSFTLDFTYGSTTVVSTTKTSYYAGFAAFTGFQSYEMTENEFDSAEAGSYAKVVSLTGDVTDADGDSGFDSVAGVPSNAIESGYANAKNYRGVYSDSLYVSNGTNVELNTKDTAGLLNKEYADNYSEIFTQLGAENWESIFGDATQPLVIYNEKADEKAYGFLGKSSTISANTYKTISLRVKVSDGAKAYVYLTDMDDDSFKNSLTVSRQITYWYDDDGNICAKDPSDEHFQKKDIAFKLQSNGLYKVNPSWEGASGVDANAYYANLANYEKDSAGNLIVADGGASYNYNDKWDNEGQDGIAYYYKDGNYYADAAKTILVTDLSEVSSLTPRYTATKSSGMCFEISSTNGKWATVSFNIHTGDTAKNYRLEVWSGERNGAGNPANSYVIFDSYTTDDVTSDTFAELTEERKDSVSEDDYFESVFSFFDSAKYLRYNETIDENEIGYSYESYLPSEQTESIAFLKYEGDNVYEVYADYALSEKTVTPDEKDDDTTTDDDDDHDHDSETNIWLLASSISVAVVLLIAVASIIIRKIAKDIRKKKNAQAVLDKNKKANK